MIMRGKKHRSDNSDISLCRTDSIAGKEIPVIFGSQGINLKGKILLPSHASAEKPIPCAILCHGFGSDRKAMETGAALLVNKGIAAIIFDLRGHGDSEGALDGDFHEDVIDAWQTITALEEVDSTRAAFIGHSLGALSSILAAAKIKKAKAVVALSCPFEIDVSRLMCTHCVLFSHLPYGLFH